MDVMSLEHHFGKEIETSLQQLFNYFCNNINLGQWQAAKACLKQLDTNKKNFKFDFNSILIDIIQKPESYSYGSCNLESPYHLSLLLYEYCTENKYIENRNEKFYDKILFKFIVYSTFLQDSSLTTANQANSEVEIEKSSKKSTIQQIVDELVEYILPDLFKEKISLSNIESPNNASSASLTSISTEKSTSSDVIELSSTTFDYLKELLINNHLKAKALIELIFKYNRASEHVFLKVHLSAINKVLENMESNKNRKKSLSGSSLTESSQSKDNLFNLINLLSMYKVITNKNQLKLKHDKSDSKSDNVKYESLALLQRCFKDICYKFNSIWPNSFEELEENFQNIYSSLLFDYNDEPESDSDDTILNINLLHLFSKIHYEIDRQITITSTFNDETIPILSLIKQYSNVPNKEFYLWRRFFLYCFMENRLLLKSIIDESLLLISKNQFDNLSLIFSIKEFLNLKPLILLIGITKVSDIQSAKKLIASICLNSDKGTLVEKIGSLLKTHLDFMTWYQQIKSEHQKKEISFNELIKLLHKQLPLNIISQYIDITKLDYAEMTKMLRNTLTEKESGNKTKWVRFVDEVNEKISLVQETCLAIYNGFYCLNEILNSILYCCENLNRKFYSNIENSTNNSNYIIKNSNLVFKPNVGSGSSNANKVSFQTKTDVISDQINSNISNTVEKLQSDYSKNVIEKFENVKKIINQISPLSFRLEILENIYSLIYLSSSDLKEPEDDESEDDYSDPDLGTTNRTMRYEGSNNFEPSDNQTANSSEGFEILTDYTNSNPKYKNYEEVEFSIYEIGNNNAQASNLSDATNRSSKSTIGSCSNGSNSSRIYRQQSYGNAHSGTNDDDEDYSKNKKSKLYIYKRNAGGGGSFLVNDFMCRDILIFLKETLHVFSSIKSSTQIPKSNSANSLQDEYNSVYLNCSISNSQELNVRLTKLQHLVNETLWRFQLVKCDLIQIEYGQITNLLFETDSLALINEKQQNLIYELMKKRKRRTSATSNGSAFNESLKQDQFVSLSINKNTNKNVSSNYGEINLALNKPKTTTVNTTILGSGISTTYVIKEQRRSLESQRSLSLIYPIHKNKRSNLTIMKLLSDIDTLSALCLKESKLSEANQLVKMYSSKKDASKSFAYRQIIFNSIYQQALDELTKLNLKQQTLHATLIEQSLQSLDMGKITESLLLFEKDNDLLQCIFLCDLLVISKLNLALCSNLIDYARIKFNQNLNNPNINNKKSSKKDRKSSDSESDKNEKKLKESSSEENLTSEKHKQANDQNKFDSEMRSKLSLFIESGQSISSHFKENANQQNIKSLIDFLINYDGICIGLNGNLNRNSLFSTIQNSIEKYDNYNNLKKNLNEYKQKFESLLNNYKSDNQEQNKLHEAYMNIMNLLNNSIKLNENEDIITAFFYKPNISTQSQYNELSVNSVNQIQDSNEHFSTSIEKMIFKSGIYGNENSSLTNSLVSISAKNSNYLLSFYEYSKTLFEYFKEKSFTNSSSTILSSSSSYFSVLNFSPASLICKLLFEDSIKPQLIESLTQKLNLNLTAIILHNSCPRLKLTLSSKIPLITFNQANTDKNMQQIITDTHDNETKGIYDSSAIHSTNPLENQILRSTSIEKNSGVIGHSIPSSDVAVYNLNSFFTILNESDIFCCSRKKPDEFLRDLLLKLLKYCKAFLNNYSTREEQTNQNSFDNISTSPKRQQTNQQFIDIKVAQEIYQCAEFKTILNESQELQHLNLYFLKTDHQKLSFFINLYNLLSIHSHFYLASINVANFKSTNNQTNQKLSLVLNDSSNNDNQINNLFLFRNKTEKLLFQQRMCYKVGQMGCISLYDMKHHILTKRCLNNDSFPNLNFSANTNHSPSTPPTSNNTIAKTLFNKISSSKSNPKQQVVKTEANLQKQNLNGEQEAQLYKYAFYTLDIDAEPLWSEFLPSEKICDYRVLFALTNCTESDPPICVYNSDSLLDDQLMMQMKLFLNESIYADLCEDVLYLPNFLVENCSFFIDNPLISSTKLMPILTETNSIKNDLESLVKFLIEHVNQELKESLKGLLDLDSIHGFGENIDQYGRKELPFPIIRINESKKFSLIIDYNHSNDKPASLWYRREINRILQQNEQNKRKKQSRKNSENLDSSKTDQSTTSGDSEIQFNFDLEERIIEDQELKLNETIHTDLRFDLKMDDMSSSQILSRQQLNKDCLEYIQKNSPLISNSLSFLFDIQKRNDFFKLLGEVNLNNINEPISDQELANQFNSSLNRFIQLYVPLDYMKHLSMQTKLNLVTQFLLTNKTEESKIELIIDLANYYTQKQEWNIVLNLLNNCTQDNEELNDLNDLNFILNNNQNPLQSSSLNANIIDLNSFETGTAQNQNTTNQKNLLANKLIFENKISNSRFSQKDLYNLYDHACICLAYQESKKNDKSYRHLFKMKNFLRQIRAIFGLMHLWSIDGCLELIDFCLTKSRIFEQPNDSSNSQFYMQNADNRPNAYSGGLNKQISLSNEAMSKTKHLFQSEYISQYIDCHNHLIDILNNKKVEFTAYKELTNCARSTLEKYYEHQQIQDAAGFYDSNNASGFSSTNDIDITFNLSNLNKMKKICQKCLTWQFAKSQLESSSNLDDEEANELIMDLFLLNDQFTSAKYLIRKLNLGHKLQFKLDFGHLKHRLLNLNVSSSIIVIDLDSILKECISFTEENSDKNYVFEICYKLLNEFKDLNELNNQVLVSLSEFLINNFKNLLNETQLKEFKILQLTAKIFQIIVQDRTILFDSYKRHHSQPLLIIEQLLMNSHIDLCSKTIKMCRESLNDSIFNLKINQLLVKYAHKALEFKVYSQHQHQQNAIFDTDSVLTNKSRSPQTVQSNLSNFKNSNANKKRLSVMPVELSSSVTTPSINLSSSPGYNSSLSSSLKAPNKIGSNMSNLNTPPNSNALSSISAASSNSNINNFVMPVLPPNKEDWIKDEEVNECMVCNTFKFSLLNRRHHCRRCGRVVCSNCSQRTTLIDNMLRRTCDDCFKQLELQKINEQARLNELNDSINDLNIGIKKIKSQFKNDPKSVTVNKTINNLENSNIEITDEDVNYYLIGSDDNETSQKRDEEVRSSFRYQQAPSTSLCLSILDLHDNPLECGKDLLNMCDDLSGYLQTANSQVEDFGLIINMIKHLLHNAKVKLLQNSSANIISLCDTYLSLIDVLEQLLLANCSIIPSLNELRNTESVRRIRNRLLEEERHDLAMNLSTKCGLDTQTVWASWGLIELKRANYKEARTKFEKCLKPVTDKNSSSSVGPTQLKILNDIVNYMENAPPIRMIGPQTLLAPLRSVESLISEPKLYSVGDTNMDDIQFKESIFYLETYGTYSLIVSFYQRHGFLENAFQFLLEKKCSSEVFTESLLIPCLKTGEFYQLLEYMLGMERSQNKLYSYYATIGKHLEKNGFLNTLYDFQILMKDYVRACMSCIFFFTKFSTTYTDLFNNLHYLNKARKHLETYLEVFTTKQYNLTAQQQPLTWKQKSEHQNLCKQMTTQEIDNYLKAINLQIEVTKFINNCIPNKKEILNQKTPTLFGNNDTKINLCCLILLSGQSIQEGFGFVIRIIQCFNLNPTLVYSQIARELAKQYNFKEINNLLKCINESGYQDEINASYDECISTCIRVFAAAPSQTQSNQNSTGSTNIYANQLQQQQQLQYNKEIEDLIQLIKDDENKINAYVLNGRLKSAYLIAIKIDRADIVKHIANVAERMGQNLIKDICIKWLEKKQQTK